MHCLIEVLCPTVNGVSTILNLARGTIQRDVASRMDPQKLAQIRRSPRARFIVVAGGAVAVDQSNPRTILKLERSDVSSEASEKAIYLGEETFVCDVSGGNGLAETLCFKEIRLCAHEWAASDVGLALAGTAISQWHRDAQFCTTCGCPLAAAPSGWERACGNGHVSYPRTDPAVIMGIRNEKDELLLGRNRAWSANRFSVLAGFVEAGENLEQAVVREVMEETGVAVDRVEYVGSQAWPFPRSLMLAFWGETTAGQADICVDGEEITHARFFSRADFSELVQTGDISVPPPASAAAGLISQWLNEGAVIAG